MGCTPSKEAGLRKSDATDDANPKQGPSSTPNPNDFREPSVVVKDQRINPQTKQQKVAETSRKVASNVKNVAHHVKNIFAVPFEMLDWNSYETPSHPKSKADEALIKKALHNNFVFEQMTLREIQPLILSFELYDVAKDEVIIQQGAKGKYFYIIQQGSVVFKVDDKEVGKAPAGASFGELALLCK
jgi:hypothetical protein